MSHLDDAGQSRMVDVTEKEVSVRVAVASARVETTAQVIAVLRSGDNPKGDALAVARIAGIQAAKRTPDLIPLCHPIAIHGVEIDLELGGSDVQIRATVRTADRTGVEMEALTSASVAGLALIDMIKGLDPRARLEAVQVESKRGGKTGDWTR
jgi:cyclic pyranopterin monophosphate synthase